MSIEIVPLNAQWRDWAVAYIIESWGASKLVSHGRIYQAEDLPGFVALDGGQPAGLLTYFIDGPDCEIITLNAKVAGKGVGSKLTSTCVAAMKAEGVSRIWLLTTNDNINAMRFYQLRGFDMKAIHHNAVLEARKIKPEIAAIGHYGIPVNHEIEFEMIL